MAMRGDVILPDTGRGTIRGMVEGQARLRPRLEIGDSAPPPAALVPLPQGGGF